VRDTATVFTCLSPLSARFHHFSLLQVEINFLPANRNDEKLKRHYQAYCKILLKVIKEAKKLYYDTKIKKLKNKFQQLGKSLRS